VTIKNRAAICRILGCSPNVTRAEFEQVPLDRLRKVVEKFAPPPKPGEAVVTKEMLREFGEARGAHEYHTARLRYPPGTSLERITKQDWQHLEAAAPELARKARGLLKQKV